MKKIDLLLMEYIEELKSGHKPDRASLLDRAGAEASQLSGLMALHDDASSGRALVARSTAMRVPNRTLGRFHYLTPIGKGESASVYRAFDSDLRQNVALKLYHSQFSAEERLRRSCKGRVHVMLNHAGLAQLYDIGHHDEVDFVAMQLVEGPSLQGLIEALRFNGSARHELNQRDQALLPLLAPLPERIRLAITLADALSHAHQTGILDHGVCPANVVLDQEGNPKLLGVGVAINAGRGGPVLKHADHLTPASPGVESGQGRRYGSNELANQRSLGLTIKELLLLDYGDRLPADLLAVIERATADGPEDRYASVGDLRDDLQAFIEHRPVKARRGSKMRRTLLFLQRHPNEVLTLIAGTALLLSWW